MKYTIGNKGTPIPRILNPLVFLFGACVVTLVAGMCLVVAALFVLTAPFSFITVLKIKESK